MSKKKSAKNQRERNAYWEGIRRQSRIDTTGAYGSESLSGSSDAASAYGYDSDTQKIGKRSFWAWLLHNKVTVIGWAIALIISPGIWRLIDLGFNHRVDIKTLTYRMEQAEKRISELDSNLITTDVLDLKLQLARNEMDALIPDVSTIQTQLDDIESRLDTLEKSGRE